MVGGGYLWNGMLQKESGRFYRSCQELCRFLKQVWKIGKRIVFCLIFNLFRV